VLSKNTNPVNELTGFFVAPYKQQRKEVTMKLILAVLTIRFIVELITRSRTGKTKVTNQTNVGKVQHPAEFELR
jgi:hypothetical protein